MEKTSYIGQPVRRQDAQAKVTGQAHYAGEFNLPDLAYGVVVSSTIARGRIRHIAVDEVLQLPGVLQVFSHLNVSGLARFNFSYIDIDAPPGDHFRYLQTDTVSFSMQPVALVVADTFEQARYAASVLRIEYDNVTAPETDLLVHKGRARKIKGFKPGIKEPVNKGNFDQAFAQAAVQHRADYYHGPQVHNPLEPFATTVQWLADDRLTVYDKTQSVLNSQKYITGVFGLAFAKVQVVSPYVGGGFGAALRPQYQLFMAVLAALRLKRNVRVTMTREQMFSFGHRPATHQALALGATADGTLTALRHIATSETSRFEDYVESVASRSASYYTCPNLQLGYGVVPLDLYTPLDMRAPGGATHSFALESAMDELAYKLNMDPLALRLHNYAHVDGLSGKPYSSKALRECYEEGAGRFGWSQRPLAPGTLRDEAGRRVGWGMATAMWDVFFLPTRGKVTLTADGKVTVRSGAADFGTGTYTIMSQIAAETLGLPLADVTTKLGDTDFPLSMALGGSATAGSLGSVVLSACLDIRKQLFKRAKKLPGSPFAKAALADVVFSEGAIRLATDPAVALAITTIMQQSNTAQLEKTATDVGLGHQLRGRKFAKAAHAAVFVEVSVDEDLGTVRVTRVVSAVAAGRILNPSTARSQIVGGVVWGLSMALHEEAVLDHTHGRIMNPSLGEYHVPVQADIHDIDVVFVEEHDTIVNPLGVKGVGELGIVGVAAAIANAIFHATGKRVRELPITLDKLL